MNLFLNSFSISSSRFTIIIVTTFILSKHRHFLFQGRGNTLELKLLLQPQTYKGRISRNPTNYHLMQRSRQSSSLLPAPSYSQVDSSSKLDLFSHLRHRFLHLPTLAISPDFHTFCSTINPLDYATISNQSFVNTSCVHHDLGLNIATRNYAFQTKLDTPPHIVLDTGASISITPYQSDFIRSLEPSRIKTIY